MNEFWLEIRTEFPAVSEMELKNTSVILSCVLRWSSVLSLTIIKSKYQSTLTNVEDALHPAISNVQPIFIYVLVFLRQVSCIVDYPSTWSVAKVNLHSWSSCVHLTSAESRGMSHRASLWFNFLCKKKKQAYSSHYYSNFFHPSLVSDENMCAYECMCVCECVYIHTCSSYRATITFEQAWPIETEL